MPHMTVGLPPQYKMEGMGRLWSEDPNDAKYRPPQKLVRQAEAAPRAYRYHIAGPRWDQGNTPHCVEYSTRHLMEANPARNNSRGIPRGEIYNWCQAHDEWAGVAYDGTSVRAAMKYLLEHGFIERYEWAETVEQVHAHLIGRGVALFGTTWTSNMSYVDDYNVARATGANWGGHAYMVRGGNLNKLDPVTRIRGMGKIRNSWDEWGNEGTGEAWITYADIQKLINDYGEAALPVEVKKLAA